MTRKPRETFNPEFKREAVLLLKQGDKESSQLARELGVRRNQLYKGKDGGQVARRHRRLI